MKRATRENPQDEIEEPEGKGKVKFKLPIPGKDDAVFYLPTTLDSDDWEMLRNQLDAWVKRLMKNEEDTQ